MSAHTPGPWTYFIGNANGRGLIRIEADHEGPEAGHHIASMPRGERSEADARLIAAAPDMYEALKLVNLELTSISTGGKVRAAIAKAEGRE